VKLGVYSIEGDLELAVEDQQDLFAIRSVGNAIEVGRDVQTPGAQLTASSGTGHVGAEPGAVRLECGRLC
jgi:hypothetical protein